MSLPDIDLELLASRQPKHLVQSEANMTCVLLPDFGLPQGYDRVHADLLLRLSPGYPDVPPDMWWFDPPVRLADGRSPPATESMEHYLGRTWQRWSRHLTAGQWKSGVDSIETFLALVHSELKRCAPHQ